MSDVMLQFRHQNSKPSIDDVCRIFDLKIDEVNTEFGVIATDPDKGLFTILIDEKATTRVTAQLALRPQDPAEGIFANPKIEPFGPPEK